MEKVPKMAISVTKGRDQIFKLKMRPDATMLDLKTKLEGMTGVPVQHQFLNCLRRNKVLDAGNQFQLKDHGIEDGATLYLGVWRGIRDSW